MGTFLLFPLQASYLPGHAHHGRRPTLPGNTHPRRRPTLLGCTHTCSFRRDSPVRPVTSLLDLQLESRIERDVDTMRAASCWSRRPPAKGLLLPLRKRSPASRCPTASNRRAHARSNASGGPLVSAALPRPVAGRRRALGGAPRVSNPGLCIARLSRSHPHGSGYLAEGRMLKTLVKGDHLQE